ncbi:hypothetical protein MKS88_001988 [Plasmodium brasilianum]|uniref:Secreted ookinete protein n=2 Tax=Plasmodium (Plasmodium) TaxID=418103 RepID=A0A1D3JMS7_PLAMA|nr:conserved Plasmodium protein, unknown function [Plasmodium malariae]KAI4839437.1 hypothetical protein MKS88_001988 [Plasmodium brasilianum]SBT87856.1 conserved Plasmodium protein, unknown function [Plasmodium malariae]
MTALYLLFSFFLLGSLNENKYLNAKVIHRPINVYYKDYSAHLPNEQRDKLMKILLNNEYNEEKDEVENIIDIKKIYEKEKDLENLLSKQTNLSKIIKEELRGYLKKNRKMSVKYDHEEKNDNSGIEQNSKKGGHVFDVNTHIDVSMDSMREPLVVIKIPSLNFYDLIEIQHDVGNLISVNNEELFY